MILCGLVVIAFGAWAAVSTLDIVSMAEGEVVPSTKVKTIQHLEGGIVGEIMVREGARVTVDQPLVVLETTASGADVGELQVRMAALRGDVARLEALIKGASEPTFPADLRQSRPDVVNEATNRFHARRKRHESDLRKQGETIAQRQQEIGEITTRIRSTKASLELMQEQIAISQDLMKSGLSSRFQHLDLLKEATRLKGGIDVDASSLQRANSALLEAQAGLTSIKTAYQEENQDGLEKTHRELNELTQRIQKFEDNLKRTVVRSPVDGIVKTLHVATVGGVVRGGEAVVDIVPVEDRLIIEARLPTRDIGYVRDGQSALVKLASPEAVRFGSLKGKVINVSPDTLVTSNGVPFYKVRIETEGSYFSHGSLRYELFPGMQVVASIETGKRTVLEYLTDPLRGYMSDAMHER